MKNVPPDARPREKLLTRGAASLADSELLAILLRTGLAGKGVMELAGELLRTFGGIAGLLHAPQSQLERIKGLGPAKSAELIAIMELARRALSEGLQTKVQFDEPQNVQDYVRLNLGHKPYEVFAVLYLNAQNQLLSMEELFRGTVNQTSVYPREVVQACLAHGAQAVIFAHNHPSGCMEASQSDMLLTRTLQAALHLVDVRVLDHIIVSRHEALSMLEKGWM